MDERELTFASAAALSSAIQSGKTSSLAVVDAVLDRINERDEEINAYVTVRPDEARSLARAADRAVAAGEETGALHGVPVALKDLSTLKEGVEYTFGSVLLSGYVAPRTTVAVERLERAGAIVLGTTNVSEFGHAGVTTNEVTGSTASPIAPDANAGGSSGGCAAAVAAGMAPLAIGSDAGGSVRIPAAACGVFGLKPSPGIVPYDSRPNAFGLGTHFASLGPLSRTVADAALAMEVLAGTHPRDPESVPVDIDYSGALDRSVDGLRVGYTPDLDVFPVEKRVSTVVEAAVETLAAEGATVEEISLDHGFVREELVEAFLTTFCTALYAGIETLRTGKGIDPLERPRDVSRGLLEFLAIGARRDVGDVARAAIVRTAVFDAVQDVFADYDLLATPTLATTGFPLEAELVEPDAVLTWPFNWTGHPAASVPAGIADDGRPIGVQLVGRRYEDDTVLAASKAIERGRPWFHLYPT